MPRHDVDIKPFWEFLWSRPELDAIASLWKHVLGDNLWEALRRDLFQEAGIAKSFTDESGRFCSVVPGSDGYTLIYDETLDFIVPGVEKKHVQLYKLNLRTFRSRLCDALNAVDIANTQVDPKASIFQIGSWEPKPSVKFPVYFLHCPSQQSLRDQILLLQSSFKRDGALLLTITRNSWNDDVDALARNRNMLLVPIDEILAIQDTEFVETDTWKEYLQTFAKMVKLTFPGNRRQTKPRPMRGTRLANIERLEKEMENHLLTARDHAHSLIDRNLPPVLLPRPEQKYLAKSLNMTTASVSRCINDPRAKLLRIYWESAESLKSVMGFKARY